MGGGLGTAWAPTPGGGGGGRQKRDGSLRLLELSERNQERERKAMAALQALLAENRGKGKEGRRV